MPLPVLKRHGIVDRKGDLISLSVQSLSYQQRAEIMAICEQKLGAFLKQRGLGTWDYRLVETDPVPSDIRYQVLAAYNERCALWAATSKERRIEVDHVNPRSKGGSNDISNLQALCDECNRGKSNRDDRRFQALPSPTPPVPPVILARRGRRDGRASRIPRSLRRPLGRLESRPPR